jgi:hypothetical protein
MARYREWWRAWIVLGFVWTIAVAIIGAQNDQRFWRRLDRITVSECVQAEAERQNHPDALVCAGAIGANRSWLDRQQSTPLWYWTANVLGAAATYVVATLNLVILAAIAGWVARGFRGRSGQ